MQTRYTLHGRELFARERGTRQRFSEKGKGERKDHFCSPLMLSPMLGVAVVAAAFHDAHERQPPDVMDDEVVAFAWSTAEAPAAGCSLAEAEDEVVLLALGLKAEKLGKPKPSDDLLLAGSPPPLPLWPASLAADISFSFCNARNAPPPPLPAAEVEVPNVLASALPIADCGFQVTRSACSPESWEDSCCARSRSESDRDALGLTRLAYCMDARREPKPVLAAPGLPWDESTSAASSSLLLVAGFQGVESTS